MVELVDLHKSYGDRPVLRGVSLTARRGDVVSVIGSSGSGESTLLGCINLLEPPSAGSLAIAGEAVAFRPAVRGLMHPVDPARVRRLRSGVGMVFQVMFLHDGRVEEEGTPAQVFGRPRSERCAAFVSSVR